MTDTSLELTDYDRGLVAGERGPGVRMAMAIIVRMAQVQRARRLLDITMAHIDSALYMGEATRRAAGGTGRARGGAHHPQRQRGG